MNLAVILTCAGSSSRMGLGMKKEYLPLKRDNREGTVLSCVARVFLESLPVNFLIITTPHNGTEDAKNALYADKEMSSLLSKSGTKLIFTEGGDTRQHSVRNALLKAQQNLNGENAAVLIHDAARPFVSSKIIKDTFNAVLEHGAAVPAVTPVDTQKELSSDGTIKRHLVRSQLIAVQTPQGFLLNELILCHNRAFKDKDKTFTDDTEIWDAYPEFTGAKKVHVVSGEASNKKITYKEDLPLEKKNMALTLRTGFGTDLHRLVAGRNFVLGGIQIPADKGEDGHSDGDVLLHAICDALLGASHLGDIGSYFPPSDPKWKDAESGELLKTIWADVKKEGWSLVNMDCVVETESPKILPWREKIIASIANLLEVETDAIFVKAKTNEGVDAVGTKEAVKAYCSCLIQRQDQE